MQNAGYDVKEVLQIVGTNSRSGSARMSPCLRLTLSQGIPAHLARFDFVDAHRPLLLNFSMASNSSMLKASHAFRFEVNRMAYFVSFTSK